jgi:hypothetical protein
MITADYLPPTRSVIGTTTGTQPIPGDLVRRSEEGVTMTSIGPSAVRRAGRSCLDDRVLPVRQMYRSPREGY